MITLDTFLTCSSFKHQSKTIFGNRDDRSQDTVGSAPLYSTIGGNGADGEYC